MARSRILWGAAGALALGAAAVVVYRTGLLGDRAEEQWTLVQTYCTDCHNAAEAAGGLARGRGPEDVLARRASVRPRSASCAALMPPPRQPQPDQERVDSFVGWPSRSIAARRRMWATCRSSA
jgi:hypothetical protein